MKFKYCVGQNINGVILLEKLPPLYKYYTRWKVRRADGEESIVRQDYLYMAKAIRRDKINSNAALNQLFKTYINGAKRRKLSWKLNKEQFVLITSGNCHYCNAIPSQKAWKSNNKKKGYIYNGIDRVNNDKGYEFDNVVSSCGICNKMKGRLSHFIFLKYIKKIHKRIRQLSNS